MAETQLGGVAVNFGFATAHGTVATAFTGKMALQSLDYEETADEEQVKGAYGALVNRSFYNPGYKATLEYVPTGATVAAAITNTTLPTIGSIVNITACAEMPALVKSNWIVVPGGRITGSNTAAKRITLNLESHAGVTAAIAAS